VVRVVLEELDPLEVDELEVASLVEALALILGWDMYKLALILGWGMQKLALILGWGMQKLALILGWDM
jgi:hypothetical protein